MDTIIEEDEEMPSLKRISACEILMAVQGFFLYCLDGAEGEEESDWDLDCIDKFLVFFLLILDSRRGGLAFYTFSC